MANSMKVPSRIQAVTLLLIFNTVVLMSSTGCSKRRSGPAEHIVPVSGKITLDGQPVERASVTFTPTAKNPKAHVGTGVTDIEGVFDMLNYQSKRGLPPGSYTVTVSLALGPDGAPPPEDRPLQSSSNQLIPDEWSSIAKAGKHNTVTVPDDGRTDFEFKIPKKH